MTIKPDPLAYPPRGLNHDEAARYVGVGPTLFDEMVMDGRMPRPKRVNNRVVWDRVSLDYHFAALPGGETSSENILDGLLQRGGKFS